MKKKILIIGAIFLIVLLFPQIINVIALESTQNESKDVLKSSPNVSEKPIGIGIIYGDVYECLGDRFSPVLFCIVKIRNVDTGKTYTTFCIFHNFIKMGLPLGHNYTIWAIRLGERSSDYSADLTTHLLQYVPITFWPRF